MATPGPRTRSTSFDPGDGACESVQTDYLGGSSPSENETTTNRSFHQTTLSSTINDVVTADFRKRIRNGEIINNPFNKSDTETYYPPAAAHDRSFTMTDGVAPRGWVGTVVSGDIAMADTYCIGTSVPGFSSAVVAERSRVIDLAVVKAHANIDTSEMLALATLAESRKTVDFFANSLMKLLKIIRAVRKLDALALKRQFSKKELANMYMELRYAIRPLFYDVNGLLDSLEAEVRSYDRKTFRGYASGSVKANDSVPDTPVGWELKATIARNCTYTVSARAGVLCSTNVTNAQIFGIDRIAETAWELVPFSFIVDWFLNVGTAIAALTPNAGVVQRASWVTVKEEITETNTMASIVSTLVGYDRTNSVSWSTKYGYKQKLLERIVDPTLNVWPTIGVRLDTFKIADLGIILKGLTSSKF